MLALGLEFLIFLVVASLIWWAFTMLYPLLPLPEPVKTIIYTVLLVIFVVVVVIALCNFLLAIAGVITWHPLLLR